MMISICFSLKSPINKTSQRLCHLSATPGYIVGGGRIGSFLYEANGEIFVTDSLLYKIVYESGNVHMI